MRSLSLLVALAACAAPPPPAAPPPMSFAMFPGMDADTDAMLREIVLNPKPTLLPSPLPQPPEAPKVDLPPLPTMAECMAKAAVAARRPFAWHFSRWCDQLASRLTMREVRVALVEWQPPITQPEPEPPMVVAAQPERESVFEMVAATAFAMRLTQRETPPVIVLPSQRPTTVIGPPSIGPSGYHNSRWRR